MKVRIIVDSACDMTKDEADREQISFLPLKTIFGDREYQDGITITPHEFYEKLIEEEEMPSTSQVTPYEFQLAYEQALEEYDQILVITISGKLSGTYQSAMVAAQGLEDKVYVVDSENVSIGTQILVRYAMRLRNQGMDGEQIASTLNECKKKICLIGLLDTLEYLRKGGRISKTSAFAGELLSIKPVISIEDGLVVTLGKARGSKKGNNMLIETIQAKGGVDFSLPYGLAYGGLSDALLRKYVEDSGDLWKYSTDYLPVSILGSTIGTHAGPGAIAVAFFAKNI